MTNRTVSVRLRAVTDQFQRGMRQAAESMGRLESSSEQLSRTGRTLSRRVTAPLMALGGAAVAVGMRYESAMSGVAAVTGETGAALERMGDTAQEMGRTTQFSASEAAGALEFLGMAGFSAEESMSALPDTLNLAAAGGMELAQAADLASNVLQQFALDVEDTQRVTDVMAATASNANTSVEQMGQALQMAGPIANAAGMEIEETAAVLGAMGDAGIQATTAGTSLRMAMSQLLNASGPAADVLERLGIEATTSAGELRPMAEIIDELGDASATAGDLMEIFGARAGPGMAALVEQGGDALRELEETLEGSFGEASRQAEERMDNLSGDLKELRSAAEGAGIALYEAGIDDTLRGWTQSATGAIQSIAELEDATLRWAIALGGVAAASGPALQVLGVIGRTYRPVVSGFASMGGAATSLGTNLGVLTLEATNARTVLGGLARIGGATAALWAAGEAVDRIGSAIHDSIHGAGPTVDELTLAMEGLARTGEAPEAVAGSFDALGDAFEARDIPGWAQQLRGVQSALMDIPVASQAVRLFAPGFADDVDEWERGGEAIQEADRSLALMAASGNDRAVSAGLEELGQQLGISGAELDRWVQDNLPAYVQATEDARRATDEFQNRLAQTDAIREYGGHMERMPRLHSDTADAMGDVAGAAGDAAGEIGNLNDMLDTLAGAQLGVQETQRNWIESLENLSETVKDNGDTLDVNTESGRANQQALEDGVRAAFDHGQAMVENGESVDIAAGAVQGMIGDLVSQAGEFGMTEAKAAEYIEQLGLTPEEIYTELSANWGEARTEWQRVAEAIGRIPENISTTHTTHLRQVGTQGSNITARASGGPVSHGQAYLVGEEGPELVTFGTSGMVHDAASTSAMQQTPGLVDGSYDVEGLSAMTRGPSFGTSGEHAASIEQMRDAYDDMSRAIEDIEQSKRRQAILDRQAAANTKEDRQAAKDELDEFDRQARLTAERRQIEDRIAQAEANNRLKVNREELVFERASTDERLSMLDRRIDGERRYSDEWTRLTRDRIDLLQREADAASSAYDDGLDELNRMLDEEQRINRRREEAQRNHQETVAEANRRASEATVEARRRALDQIDRLEDDRARALTTDLGGDGWNRSASGIADLLDRESGRLVEWADSLDELRAEGLDDAVIDMLGLGDGPQALGQAKVLLRSSHEEIARLNEAAADHQSTVGAQVARERVDGVSDLARDVAEVERDLSAELRDIQAERQETLDEAERRWHEVQRELADELAAIGQDMGRGYAEAIAEGMASGLPAIEQQVAEVEKLLARRENAARAAQSDADRVASMRAGFGLPGDARSDQIWEDRLAAGTADWDEVERRLRDKADTFDSGGVLTPGLNLAYNGTGRNEFVMTPVQVGALAGSGTSTTVNVYGNLDNVTLQDVEKVVAKAGRDNERRQSRRLKHVAGSN